MDFLKIGKADELKGRDQKIYRLLEILPGFCSWLILLSLVVLSYFRPILVAYFIIAFDIYWLLLVIYLMLHLVVSYRLMKKNLAKNWREELTGLPTVDIRVKNINGQDEIVKNVSWPDIIHLLILPVYKESLEIMRPTIKAIIDSGYPLDKIIIVIALEARAGQESLVWANLLMDEFGLYFRNFLISVHPDNIPGEIKGKGSNQAWAAKLVKVKIIDKENLDYNKIIVSVFDIDTVIYPEYFHILTYKFLTSSYPHRLSYQPIPIYNNNIWEAPFFSRVAASSNTFWQMMQQIRQEKLATYSSHAMSWRALSEIGFWSTNMVSEDSRIFWHCFCYYRGDYRVEPLHYPVSMDVCMDEKKLTTIKNLYKQQRRWGWGVENIPYLIFNTLKIWPNIPKGKFINRIIVQLYGFLSWSTNALIIAVIGWLPLFLGGNRFTSTVLSNNLPSITRTLMTLAMTGLVVSAIMSTLLLPSKPKNFGFIKYVFIVVQWMILPISIIIFGAIPGLEAQTRLMLGKYLGFWTTPKTRSI